MHKTTTVLLATAVLTAVGCGGPDADGTPVTSTSTTTTPVTTIATETTLDPAESALQYAQPGPHPVGVTTLQLDKGPLVEVWYPAVAGTTGTDTYDVRDYVPEGVRALFTADIPAGRTYAASRDAAVEPQLHPVVLFSHGFSGVRVQSTYLTAQLASYGFIVAAPEHPSRDLNAVLALSASGDRTDAIDDLSKTLDLLLALNDDPGSPFHATVDPSRVGALGHSAGGATVLGAANSDPRIRGYVSMASGWWDDTDTADTSTTQPALPAVPSFFIAGSTDGVVPPETVTRPAFEAAPSPSLLWIIDGAGHNAFDDFCTFGDGAGVIGVARASGLGNLLGGFGNLVALGEDGCIPPALPVDETMPIVQHAVVKWLIDVVADGTLPGLGAEYSDLYVTPVTIEVK